MHFKKNIRKAALFLITYLLFSSFKSSDLEFDKKYTNTICKSITKIFNNSAYQLRKSIGFEEAFYSIKQNDIILGYFIVTQAPSKFHQFDYYIIFNNKADVLKVEVLCYRENYGGEICNKNWLKQFAGLETNNYVRYNRNINGISGATISVNSIKKDIFKLTNSLKESITK